MSNNTKIIIGLIVVFIVTILIFIQTSVIPTPVAYESVISLPSSSVTPEVTAPRGPIDVPDQPASSDILVKSVTMPADGYIIIHALSPENHMSGIIGNSVFLAKGVHTTIRITLYGKGGVAYSVKSGDQFVAALYKDNGDKKYGEGDLAVALKDPTGSNIVQRFKAL